MGISEFKEEEKKKKKRFLWIVRGCMNSIREQYHKKDEKKKSEREKRKRENITQRPTCLNAQHAR